MQHVLPLEGRSGSPSGSLVDLRRGQILPVGPRAIGHLLGRTADPLSTSAGLQGSLLLRSLVFSQVVFDVAEKSTGWVSENADLCRILAATHHVGKVFGGDLHPDVPAHVRSVVDGYHEACRSSVRRQLGLAEPSERIRVLFDRVEGYELQSGADTLEAKLLRKARLDRWVSAYVSMFRVRPDRPPAYRDEVCFVEHPGDGDWVVALTPLYRTGHAVSTLRSGGRL